MKKIFTLIAMATMALGASAQESWVAPAEAPAAGTAIIKGDLMKVSTEFETTCGTLQDEDGNATPAEFAGKTFNTYMQIRVDAAPTAAVPTGTDKGGSTPLIIEAKENVDITVYYRRQSVSVNDGESFTFADNDGKDLKLIDQSAPASPIAAATFTYEEIGSDHNYANTIKTYKLDKGKTYTLFARGTTIRLYGIDYQAGSGTGSDQPAGDDNVFTVSFNGSNVQSTEGYFTFNPDKHNFNKKFAATYDGVEYTQGLKMEAATLVQWTAEDVATVTVVQSTWSANGFFIDDVKYEATTATEADGYRVYTIEAMPSGTHKLTRVNADNDNAGESGIFFVKVAYTPGVTPTGIKNVNVNDVKYAPAYNLAGQKVSQSYKGVVIQNGAKRIQK